MPGERNCTISSSPKPRSLTTLISRYAFSRESSISWRFTTAANQTPLPWSLSLLPPKMLSKAEISTLFPTSTCHLRPTNSALPKTHSQLALVGLDSVKYYSWTTMQPTTPMITSQKPTSGRTRDHSALQPMLFFLQVSLTRHLRMLKSICLANSCQTLLLLPRKITHSHHCLPMDAL